MGLFLIPGILIAQNQRHPAFRERLLNARFNEISTRMQLEPARAEKLKPVFMRYEKEKASVSVVENELQRRKERGNLTEEQEEELYISRLERAKKLIEIREKYYPEFRTVLSLKEVVQFHHLEMELNRRMMQQIRKRLNEKEE